MAKELIIPSNPDDLDKLKKGIVELTNSMVRVDGERDFQKEAAEDLAEQTGVDKKYIMRIARDYHKNRFDEKVTEMDEYTQLYESVMK